MSKSEPSIPPKLLYRQGDVVQLKGLKSKTHWNGKRAEIIGLFDESTKRWPIRLLRQPKKKGGTAPKKTTDTTPTESITPVSSDEQSTPAVTSSTSTTTVATDVSSSSSSADRSDDSSDKSDLPRALLKPSNMKLLSRGKHWTLDPVNNDGQLLYMIMHAYTKDFNAFAQLTRRKKSIFHKDFTYRMHTGTVVTGLSQFDASLNRLKKQISEMSDSTATSSSSSKSSGIVGKIDPYFSDKTHVEVVDSDSMSKFKVVVIIDLRETEHTRLMQRKTDGTSIEVPTTGLKRKPKGSDSFQSREWVRTTLVELKGGLVWKCTFLGYEIRYPMSNEETYTKPKSADESSTATEGTADDSKRDDLSGIVSAIQQAKVPSPESEPEPATSIESSIPEDSKSEST